MSNPIDHPQKKSHPWHQRNHILHDVTEAEKNDPDAFFVVTKKSISYRGRERGER